MQCCAEDLLKVIVVLKLLCKREWSDLDVGLVKSGQKTLESLSCICIFFLKNLCRLPFDRVGG